jgi:D-methionine transport system substrate-binding protein
MKKNSLVIALTLALTVAASVTGCSGKSAETTAAPATEAATTEAATTSAETTAEAEKAADASEIPGPDGDDKTISIGVTPVPHAEIVNDVVKKKLEDAGWKLDVVEFNDYVQPNTALEDGELDANYFQTIRYLEEQNEERGLHLKAVAGIHLEPMGLYATNAKTLDELQDGASIAIPNDGSNESRAIKLLADNNLITLTETDDLYTLQNIAENPHNYEFVELEAANLPRSLDDVDAAVINGNYALEANLNPQTDALVAELADSDESYKYINYLVVKEGNEETAKTKALIAALENDDVKKYIEDTYSGSVIPAF